jgi:hypothetical protein
MMIGDYGDAIKTSSTFWRPGAWKGLSAGAHHLPLSQVVSSEQILDGTSPGYQILYNEIFWSFENLEPTSQDNILVSIVRPPG